MITKTRILPLFCCYLLATFMGYLAAQLKLPLPWMIGPLVGMALINMFIKTVDIPVRTRPIGQIIIAVQVGLHFTSDAFSAVLGHAGVIIGLALATIFMGYVLSLLLQKITGADPVTAFLSCLPGGPVEMGNLAKTYGGDPGPVIFAQTLRISSIVIIIPVALYYLSHTEPNAQFLLIEEWSYLGMTCVSLGAIATCALFYVLRINSAFFLGALAFSCTASVTEFIPISPYPHEILACGQILLGTWLGSTFRKEIFQRAGRLVMGIFATATLLILTSAFLALIVSQFSDINWRALVLGSAPGSVTEMALTAQFLNEDVALITAFHLVRIFLILPNVPWMLALVRKRDKKLAS
ncbi:AbrB family transcriptional regulator [Marinomonas sp. BSi20584]|uniref:AbrB family transcriptional regulator n=1 Tax=Marinomonas sp. BSi20584 TaxID=1594462 RepID=UPI000C1F5267|nr:AbrB family transcriptional regulator [Marinomonas sp. BSi20584]PJE53807.1 hypothetical protein TY87_18505 [Marinomonas sp. BSi20584]